MDAQIVAQRDFSAGQIDDSALRADDTDIQRAGLRTARNVRIRSTRTLTRRPGRRVLFPTTGICEIIRPTDGSEWYLSLEPERAVFRRKDLSAYVEFTGMPWGPDILRSLKVDESGGVVIVTHRNFTPRTFTYDRATGGWSYAVFQFAQDPNGAWRMPFYNFVLGSGVTLQPSGRIGTVSIDASGPVFHPLHFQGIFRYAGRQFQVVHYVSPTRVFADVIEEFPPTYLVTVDNTAGLQVGDVIEGVTSGARGQVSGIAGLDLSVLVEENWSGFTVDELAAGPRSKMKVTGQSLAGFATPTTQWDEALISFYRGWPGCVSRDAQRVIFCDLVQAGAAVVWSATGTLNDFAVGAEREDAIFEFLPVNCVVVDVQGGADELVFTDRGIFYVPVSASNPLIPGSIDFRQISDDPSSRIRPKPTSQGMVFINSGLTRVFAIVATGQPAQPYLVEDITEYHSALIRQPIALATSTADATTPERYLYAANADGTLAVARYQRVSSTRSWVGWVPWDGAGTVEWVASGGGTVIVTASYSTDAGTVRFVEAFDDNLLLDASQSLASVTGEDPLELSPGDPLELSAGVPLILDQTLAFNWAVGTELSVEKNGWFRGVYTVDEDGSLSGVIPVANVVGMNGGFNFVVEVEPFVPHAEGGQARGQRLRRRRLKRVAATVQRSQAVEVAGYLVPFYAGGENEEQPPPLRDEVYRTSPLGRDFDPRWSVKQSLPGRLNILELTTEVTT